MNSLSLMFLLAFSGLPAATQSTMRQGGILQIVLEDTSMHSPTCRGSVVMEGYRGRPLRALQFRLHGGKGVRFTSAVAGSALDDRALWFFGSLIAPEGKTAGTDGEDTIRVVLFAKTAVGLSSSVRYELLRFTFDTVSNRRTPVRFHLEEVLGALENGEEAGVIAGPEHLPGRPEKRP